MKSFVYVMECAGLVKIGVAKNVSRRKDMLQVGNPLEISVFYSRAFEARRAREVERAAHRVFTPQRIRGEWFEVSPDKARDFIAERPSEIEGCGVAQSVIDWIGSQAALARALGCSSANISLWHRDGIPANRAIQIERLTSGKFRAAKIAREDFAKKIA
jgi:hypothetical protein